MNDKKQLIDEKIWLDAVMDVVDSAKSVRDDVGSGAMMPVSGGGFYGDLVRGNQGLCMINCTENNTHVTFSFPHVEVIGGVATEMGVTQMNASTGHYGFKGTKRGTAHAAEVTVYNMARDMVNYIGHVEVILKGNGQGRSVVVKALQKAGLNVLGVSDSSSSSHNGCREKKERRV